MIFFAAVIILIYSLLGTLSYLKAAAKLHHNMLVSIMRAPMSFFDTTPSGRIVNRFSGDVQTIDVTLPMTFRMWIMIAFQTLSTVIVISISTPIFLSVIVPLGIFYYFIQVIVKCFLPRGDDITTAHLFYPFEALHIETK